MKSPHNVRVLIVDDSAMFRQTMGDLLVQIGYTVVGQAVNGRQGVALTQSLRPDVVLMDIEMPDLDGIQAARYIQANCPTPVVVVTAHDTPHLVEQAVQTGVVGAYLIKPPQVQEMERAIMIAIARFGDMLELRRLNAALQARNSELQAALARVKVLSGLLPICASCKKIRNDKGYWQQVEGYLQEHADVEFSHGICPECARKLYPDLYKDR